MATNQFKMGSEQRTNCPECGDTKFRLYIRRVVGGWIRHCHNNNCYEGSAFIPEGKTTPSETVKNVLSSIRLDETCTETFVKEIRLPSDTSISIIPSAGLAWLRKYYITDEEIQRFGIGYSDRYKRLILPVFERIPDTQGELSLADTKLVYWQGRNLKPPYTKDNPKYLNIRQSGAKSIFFRVKCKSSLFPNQLVIVEDILSAIRVGRTHNSLALLGSYFPPALIAELDDYDSIIIYLDADKWKTAIKAAAHIHTITGKNVIVKHHPKDPKELTPDALEDYLKGDK